MRCLGVASKFLDGRAQQGAGKHTHTQYIDLLIAQMQPIYSSWRNSFICPKEHQKVRQKASQLCSWCVTLQLEQLKARFWYQSRPGVLRSRANRAFFALCRIIFIIVCHKGSRWWACAQPKQVWLSLVTSIKVRVTRDAHTQKNTSPPLTQCW